MPRIACGWRAEFREGFLRCEDCDTALVETLPEPEDRRRLELLTWHYLEDPDSVSEGRIVEQGSHGPAVRKAISRHSVL